MLGLAYKVVLKKADSYPSFLIQAKYKHSLLPQHCLLPMTLYLFKPILPWRAIKLHLEDIIDKARTLWHIQLADNHTILLQ